MATASGARGHARHDTALTGATGLTGLTGVTAVSGFVPSHSGDRDTSTAGPEVTSPRDSFAQIDYAGSDGGQSRPGTSSGPRRTPRVLSTHRSGSVATVITEDGLARVTYDVSLQTSINKRSAVWQHAYVAPVLALARRGGVARVGCVAAWSGSACTDCCQLLSRPATLAW